MRSLIKDLKGEIEALQLEIDSTDENNNCNIEVADKVFNTNTSGRGTAYNHKIRQVYYTLRSIGISVSKIDFVIRSVLSMVDIDIDFLPSKSTAANITSELGLVARQQLIRVITKLPNSEQSDKGKVKTHKYINRQNQPTIGKL